jgi:hypothetical protein
LFFVLQEEDEEAAYNGAEPPQTTVCNHLIAMQTVLTNKVIVSIL